ncbi:aromatic-ring-hydroxylating dioxygenase subunit beta [Natrarchaeobius oligotrophus]|uniref:Phenylpropionate dioxygenase n=1 Tax=Natrarchaeobius chitinivorans TaxID=1679083 RepID=A0A3N6N0T2_NATCH|nr:aromatic-ring-hydroxylating dioxygenase subunit beta [Natrarchaeobius chitinivorans]RQH02442.1 phenylpropionate dioxygenase [Natrarchaeobius chitinivorans]
MWELEANSLRESCENFLYREAQLLDDRDLLEWHETLITDDVEYRVPVRTTKERSAETEFSEESFHMIEDWGSLKVRVERMENDFAWSEDPPSRNRRFVSNVRVADEDPDAGEVSIRSNLLVHRLRANDTEPDLLSAERRDTLRRVDGSWRLADRTVLLDHTVVGTPSLSIIL